MNKVATMNFTATCEEMRVKCVTNESKEMAGFCVER